MFAEKYAHLPVFTGFSAMELDVLDSLMDLVSFDSEQVIFKQATKAEYLHILLEGEVSIHFKPYDGPAILVSNILPGGVFGWSAIVGREEYTSQATCSHPGLTYRIRGQDVTLLCNRHPEIGEKFIGKLLSGINERIHSSHSQMRDSLSQGKKIIDMYIRSIGKNG